MQLFYTCNDCKRSIKVSGDYDHLQMLCKDSYACPWCESSSFRCSKFRPGHSPTVDMEWEEFFKTVNGAGLPDEIVTQVETVVAMLRAHKIIDVEARQMYDRCIVDSIDLDNGVRLHFASSGYGAVVYKMTRKES